MNPKGYLPHALIKGIVFWVLSLCIAVGTISAILREWGHLSDPVASQCQVTAVVLALGSVGFLIINFLFGDMSFFLLGQEAGTPTQDPAFSERLRRAKIGTVSGALPSEGHQDTTTSASSANRNGPGA